MIAIIGILMALLLPAIQASREAARRAQCTNQLRQLILAVHDYELAHEHYPAGTVDTMGPIKNVPSGHHISWIARILPYLEENALFGQLDLALSAYHNKNDRARQTVIDILICPSNPSDYEPYSSYAGCHHDVEAPIDADNRGVFFLNSRLTRDDIKDGAAYTLFLGEKLIDDTDLGWLSGTRGTLRNTGWPLNSQKKPGTPWASGSLQWLYQYDPDDSAWSWSEQQIDPITGQTLQLNPDTGEYEPVDASTQPPIDDAVEPPTDEAAPTEETALTNEAAPPTDEAAPPTDEAAPPVDEAQPTDGAAQPSDDATDIDETADVPAEPEGTAPVDAEMFGELEAKPELKADENGLFPHSRLGGNLATPLMGGGFSSRHADGVNFALGDGSVRFIAESASAGLLGRLANRADGQTIDAKEW